MEVFSKANPTIPILAILVWHMRTNKFACRYLLNTNWLIQLFRRSKLLVFVTKLFAKNVGKGVSHLKVSWGPQPSLPAGSLVQASVWTSALWGPLPQLFPARFFRTLKVGTNEKWGGLRRWQMIGVYLGLWWSMSFCLLIWRPSCIKSVSSSAYSSPIIKRWPTD